MREFFNAVFYQPLYNGLVFLIDILPSADVGIAVIILTLLVKFLILPLSIKATRTQMKLKVLEPKIKELQTTLKDKREEQAQKMLEMYREAKVNPFSSIFLLLVQLPIIIALYLVFARGGLPEVDPERLYSFIPFPENVNMNFLGLFDVSEKSIVLACIAGVAQFAQSHLLLSAQDKKKKELGVEKKADEKKEPSFREELAKSMNLQMRYVFPLIIGFIAYTISGAVALYFIVSSLVTIAQEVFVQRKLRAEGEAYEEKPR
jgi:YidC/Oxa1 family membrane protein insertase